MMSTAAAIVIGVMLLAVAPDRFVAGSSGLADRWGVSRVVIGAVVIGFGTSTPELLVSGLAAADGKPAVGVGNIVGSNIANLGLVLAVASLVGHLGVPPAILRRELPLVVLATVGFAVAVQDGLSRPEGFVLAAGLAIALTLTVRGSLHESAAAGRGDIVDHPGPTGHHPGPAVQQERAAEEGDLAAEVGEMLVDSRPRSALRLALNALAGLVGTLAGAHLLVVEATDVAARADLSGGFVGLTVVALGTSLPELVTAVAAARAGEDQLIVGNVLGSNLFNCLGVGAVVGLVRPEHLGDAGLTVSAVGVMLAITALAAIALARRGFVSRGEAVILLAGYLTLVPIFTL